MKSSILVLFCVSIVLSNHFAAGKPQGKSEFADGSETLRTGLDSMNSVYEILNKLTPTETESVEDQVALAKNSKLQDPPTEEAVKDFGSDTLSTALDRIISLYEILNKLTPTETESVEDQVAMAKNSKLQVPPTEEAVKDFGSDTLSTALDRIISLYEILNKLTPTETESVEDQVAMAKNSKLQVPPTEEAVKDFGSDTLSTALDRIISLYEILNKLTPTETESVEDQVAMAKNSKLQVPPNIINRRMIYNITSSEEPRDLDGF